MSDRRGRLRTPAVQLLAHAHEMLGKVAFDKLDYATANGHFVEMQQLGEGNMVLYRINEKGERVAMDDAARRAERERLGKWLRENCPG